MARKLEDVLNALPEAQRQRIDERAVQLVSLAEMRLAGRKTQKQLAAELGVGQDTISRLENRSDMRLSTLRHYVESMGGQLTVVAQLPDQPPMILRRLGGTPTKR